MTYFGAEAHTVGLLRHLQSIVIEFSIHLTKFQCTFMQFERTLFIAGTFMLTGLFGCGNKEVKTETVIPEVNVVTAGQLTVPVYTEYVGQTLGISDVEIRSRVDGWIMSMHFKEGDQVKKGQLLYVIDDLPIRTRVDAAEGRVAEAQHPDGTY